ncbi:hypothetical protein Lal_00031578 [Lupinus albus]|nr:hypothetical protein Lal_00031578 [Lupinus albus]
MSKTLCETCEILQEDNFKLKEKLERLTNSKQQLDTLLSQTRNVGDRTGLGYTRSAKNKRPYRKHVAHTKNKIISIHLHVFIVIRMVILLTHVTLENMVYLAEFISGMPIDTVMVAIGIEFSCF